MSDTTQVEIIGPQLTKIVDSLTQHPTGMSSGQIALFAAAIGASAAILSQLLVFMLTRFKENSILKKKLIADERSLAFLIISYQNEAINYDVNRNYWYQAHIVHKNKEEQDDCYKKHFDFGQRYRDSLNKINITISEYFKIITHFTNLTGDIIEIDKELNKIKLFKLREPDSFSEIQFPNTLYNAAKEEISILQKEAYTFYSSSFNKINSEMKIKRR